MKDLMQHKTRFTDHALTLRWVQPRCAEPVVSFNLYMYINVLHLTPDVIMHMELGPTAWLNENWMRYCLNELEATYESLRVTGHWVAGDVL